ncbi:lim and transglutaminase domain protein ltd-1-like [Mytilus californianus]|uniref:lim and transglutaminase domain protein ltd-1-like n=1 Tax=Mytilus californianus TaxID=6549 RepID=UPI0022462A65|nr:lim and transglutaminase domain protein ltd-1-like [Mytilus californianus]
MSAIQLKSKRSSKRLLKHVNSKPSLSTVPTVEVGPDEDGLTYPDPAPPVSTKSQIYHPEEFFEIEQHVLEVSLNAANDYSTLLDYLLSNLESDLAKVRAIFCWIVQQKVPFLLCQKDIPSPDTPVGHLHAIRMRKGTYAQLFAIMCRKAGLPCVVIHGVAKGVNYNVGDKIDTVTMKNSWNAVFVEGNWRIIHPHWSLMTSNGYETGAWTVVDCQEFHTGDRIGSRSYIVTPKINDSYFLIDPEMFIIKCLPNDFKWQLLDDPISKADFENKLFLQPNFFKLGLQIIEPKSCKVLCNDGKIKIVIQMPEKIKSRLKFSYKLFRKRYPDDEGEYTYPSLEKFVLHYYSKNETIFEVRFPPVSVGTYKMQIFCVDINEHEHNNSGWVCDFCLACKNGMDECLPLPLVPEIGWGAREEYLEKYNMTALAETSGKVNIDESLETVFKFTVDPDSDIYAELSQSLKAKSELSDCVTVVKNKAEVVVKVKPPQEGEYALQIFCKDTGTLMYENVCNYLLERTEVVEEPKMAETRKLLLEAVSSGSPENLQAALKEFELKGLIDKGEYTKAKRKLLLSRLNKEIREAIAAKDLDTLDKTMHNLSETSLKKDLGLIYQDAEELRSRLRKLKRLHHAVLAMDQKTISELRSYPQPPNPVHGVMAATFLLLGHKETDLKKWATIQGLISKRGKEGLKRKVANINISKLKKANLQKAKFILSKYDLESVQIASSGAATFYQWATTMINEYVPERVQRKT